MWGKTKRIEENIGSQTSEKILTKGRLDLNDLLRRCKEKEKVEKRNNILVVSTILCTVSIVILIFSL